MSVVPGTTCYIYIGGEGTNRTSYTDWLYLSGGFNGGGRSGGTQVIYILQAYEYLTLHYRELQVEVQVIFVLQWMIYLLTTHVLLLPVEEVLK